MRILDVVQAGTDFRYKWPSGNIETFPSWIEYRGRSETREHTVRVAFGLRPVYGRDRLHPVVFLDGYPHAEFVGVDDFETTGEVVSEIRVRSEAGGAPMCRYPEDVVPERYSVFRVGGLPTRIEAKWVHRAWAVLANVWDHKTMIDLAVLRQAERS